MNKLSIGKRTETRRVVATENLWERWKSQRSYVYLDWKWKLFNSKSTGEGNKANNLIGFPAWATRACSSGQRWRVLSASSAASVFNHSNKHQSILFGKPGMFYYKCLSLDQCRNGVDLCVFSRHGAHAPGVRINPGHSEYDGSGGPLPAGAEHAGSSRT